MTQAWRGARDRPRTRTLHPAALGLARSPPVAHEPPLRTQEPGPLHPSRPANCTDKRVCGKIFYCAVPGGITESHEGGARHHSIFRNKAMASSTFLSSASVCLSWWDEGRVRSPLRGDPNTQDGREVPRQVSLGQLILSSFPPRAPAAGSSLSSSDLKVSEPRPAQRPHRQTSHVVFACNTEMLTGLLQRARAAKGQKGPQSHPPAPSLTTVRLCTVQFTRCSSLGDL